MKNWIKIFLFCFIAVSSVGCDRVTKELAKEHLKHQPPISYLHNTFILEYAENTGAFLSFGDNLPKAVSFWVFGILPLLFLLLLFIYAIRKSKETSLIILISLALIFAGGVGNIIDRLFYDRHVTDFMNVGFNRLRTGIFNFADLNISTGVILLLLFYRQKKKDPVSIPGTE